MEFGTSLVDKEIESLINLETFLVAWNDIKNKCHVLWPTSFQVFSICYKSFNLHAELGDVIIHGLQMKQIKTQKT